MELKAVLFDLDGTLLPMDQDVFTGAYFKGLGKRLAKYGYEPKALVDAVYKGTFVMIRNDGSKSNEAAFWEFFTGVYGEGAMDEIPKFEEYYLTDFQKVSEVCGCNPAARHTVDAIKAMGLRVALATNPLFPSVATESRIRWAGLEPSDFEFYTTYEGCRYCKPSTGYYREVAERIGLDPRECLMVGNDVGDDMVAADIGMKVFLLTDCLINKKGEDISRYPNGGFAELIEYVRSLAEKE